MPDSAITRVSLEHIVADLPSIQPWSGEILDDLPDVVVAAPGFEDRSLALVREMSDGGLNSSIVMLLEYPSNVADNAESMDAWCAVGGDRTRIYPVRGAGRAIVSEIREAARIGGDEASPIRVLIDTSSMSNRALFSLLHALLADTHEQLSNMPDVALDVFYAEPEFYYPFEDTTISDLRRSTLSQGVEGISVLVEAPGLLDSRLPQQLVIVPGWETDRVEAILADHREVHEIEEIDVAWLFGRPRADDDAWRNQLMRDLHEAPEGDPIYDVSTFEYTDVMLRLDALFRDRFSSHNCSVALLGSKLQAVGCALLAHCRQALCVVVASPRRYRAETYSIGVGKKWHIAFPSLKQLDESLTSIDTLDVEWG